MKTVNLFVCSICAPWLITGCGSGSSESGDGPGSVQTWRLKYSQVEPYATTSIVEAPYVGDYSIH